MFGSKNLGRAWPFSTTGVFVTPRLGFVTRDVLLSCEWLPLIEPVLNVLTFSPRALPEERQMLMSVVGSAGFQIPASSFGPKKKKKNSSFICSVFRCALLVLEDLTREEILLAAPHGGLGLTN